MRPSVWKGDKYRAKPTGKPAGWWTGLFDALAITLLLFWLGILLFSVVMAGIFAVFLGVIQMLGYPIEGWIRLVTHVTDDPTFRGFCLMNSGLAVLALTWGIVRALRSEPPQ